MARLSFIFSSLVLLYAAYSAASIRYVWHTRSLENQLRFVLILVVPTVMAIAGWFFVKKKKGAGLVHALLLFLVAIFCLRTGIAMSHTKPVGPPRMNDEAIVADINRRGELLIAVGTVSVALVCGILSQLASASKKDPNQAPVTVFRKQG